MLCSLSLCTLDQKKKTLKQSLQGNLFFFFGGPFSTATRECGRLQSDIRPKVRHAAYYNHRLLFFLKGDNKELGFNFFLFLVLNTFLD